MASTKKELTEEERAKIEAETEAKKIEAKLETELKEKAEAEAQAKAEEEAKEKAEADEKAEAEAKKKAEKSKARAKTESEIVPIATNGLVNNGGAFFHPVTHQLVQPGQFYDGIAHQDHENKE